LQQAEGSDAIGPEPVLDAGENFSFPDRGEREKGQKNNEECGNIEQAGDDLPEPIRRSRDKGEDLLLRVDEDLIDKTAHVALKESEVCFFKQDRNTSGRGALLQTGPL